MRARTVNENINFERGRDPRKSMGIGSEEYIYSMDWPTTKFSLKNVILNNPDLEILEYKGFTILLYPEEDYKDFKVHNPWKSDDIWVGLTNSRKEMGETGAHTRGDGRKKTLDNLKRSINYRLRNSNESVNFEKGRDPKFAMGIGISKKKFMVDGEEWVIDVNLKTNEFVLNDFYKVRMEFREDDLYGDEETEFADVYVDGEKQDMNAFVMKPFPYEFKEQGEYSEPGHTSYGFPIAKDKDDLKRLRDKHAYWHVTSGDYQEGDKDPFVAVAKLMLKTY